MTKKEALKVAKEMQARGFETSLAHWNDTKGSSYSVNGKDGRTGGQIRIDNTEQWEARKDKQRG